jgi:apolipoprotein D and lipocalin family protein
MRISLIGVCAIRQQWCDYVPKFIFVFTLLIVGTTTTMAMPPLVTVNYVDIERFMGRWYVIASIPTFIEKNIFNATETYSLNPDRSIDTIFSFNQDSFDGPRKTYNPTGYVVDSKTNAVWGMQFIWPIKSDFRIVYLDSNYNRTVIAREKRDHVWLMARQPTIERSDFDELTEFIGSLGYSLDRLKKVPQRWDNDSEK